MTRIQCICPVCQKPFSVTPLAITQGRGKYCSRDCHHAAHRVEQVCTQCGKTFVRIAHYLKRRPFCSRACSDGFHRPIADRFWEKVIKDGPVMREGRGPCWEWDGSKVTEGYGRLQAGEPPYRLVLSHRVSWELHVGPIPEGLNVLHHCDYPPCTRPDHLFLGTLATNAEDAVLKGRYPGMKLTPAYVREIRQALQQPSPSIRRIAEHYHVSIQAIYDIRSGRRWSHLS